MIGVMQGRLVPPADGVIQAFPRLRWADEFALAVEAHLDSIEWIYDEAGADINPIATNAGSRRLQALSDSTGVRIASVCADYFIDRPLLRSTAAEIEARLARLVWLIERSSRTGIEHIVVPFVDASRIEDEFELRQVATILRRAVSAAEQYQIGLYLETSLSPEMFAQLLEALHSDVVRVNYDTGNSASLSYDPREEFEAYGRLIGAVHVKDRVRGGTTVPLGVGDTDFPTVFDCLLRCDYRGDFILQVARDASGDEVSWAVANRRFVQHQLNAARARRT
jgi:L-ribulose-5-phosphate 3-epimerase